MYYVNNWRKGNTMFVVNVIFMELLLLLLSICRKSFLETHRENLASICPRLEKGNITVSVDCENIEVNCSLLHGICVLWLHSDSRKGESRAG